MAQEKVLVVDDEESILELLDYNLSKNGYAVVCVSSGEDCLSATREHQPSIILLDLMLPGVDGLDVCKILKSDPQTRSIPIIMVSAKGEEADVVIGLELGADDYITKPFSIRVLLARVKAVLRRQKKEKPEDNANIVLSGLVIDPERHEVLAHGEKVELTYTEFGILTMLAKRPGRVFTRNQIIDAVRGSDYPVTDRSVDVQIVGLRKKLGDCGNLIETVRGVGYRFKETP